MCVAREGSSRRDFKVVRTNSMKQIMLVAMCLFSFCAVAAEVSLLDYGAIPNDGRNDLAALRDAAQYCREHADTTLVLPPGVYDVEDDAAVKLMNDVIGGAYGNDPQRVLYQPDFPHVRILDFTGAKNLTVRADGATLLQDGWYQPVTLDNCDTVTLRGLTIEHKRMPFSTGKIINVERGRYDVQFEERFPMPKGKLCVFLLREWDPVRRVYTGTEHWGPGSKALSGDTFRFFGKCDPGELGQYAVAQHSAHGAAGIMIRYSKDIVLEDVSIHSHAGMGVVGHRIQNLTMHRLRIVPRAGELVSTNTDATHFTSCTGTILYDACQFEGQGDDCSNVHGYYQTVKEKLSDTRCRAYVKKQSTLHALSNDCPLPGETMELVSAATLKPFSTRKVVGATLDEDKRSWVIEFDAALPEGGPDYQLMNVSALPKLIIRDCQVRTHRARAFLVKTRDVLIEGCTIENSTLTAIHVGAEGGWDEGAASQNVTIRRNRIIDCGGLKGGPGSVSSIAINVSCDKPTESGLHQHILIEDNQFVGASTESAIQVEGADDVLIQRNQFDANKKPVRVEYSTNVRIEGNTGPGGEAITAP